MPVSTITSGNVFASILSMDAYNRETDEGVFLPGSAPNTKPDGKLIGDYTVLTSLKDDASGFYGIAYQRANGEIIISYRGTDDIGEGNRDLLFGWFVGLGITTGNQMSQALQFYKDVTGKTVFDATPPANVTVVGHSLGGGLAGAVASLARVKAEIIDAIPFTVAAWSPNGPPPSVLH